MTVSIGYPPLRILRQQIKTWRRSRRRVERGEDLLQDGGGEVKRLRRMGKGQGILYEADGRVHR